MEENEKFVMRLYGLYKIDLLTSLLFPTILKDEKEIPLVSYIGIKNNKVYVIAIKRKFANNAYKNELYSAKQSLMSLVKEGVIKIIESNIDNIIKNRKLIRNDKFMKNILNYFEYEKNQKEGYKW